MFQVGYTDGDEINVWNDDGELRVETKIEYNAK